MGNLGASNTTSRGWVGQLNGSMKNIRPQYRQLVQPLALSLHEAEAAHGSLCAVPILGVRMAMPRDPLLPAARQEDLPANNRAGAERTPQPACEHR
jgi:hypothetical protein